MKSRTSRIALICATVVTVAVAGCNTEPVKDDWVVTDKVDPIDDSHDLTIAQVDKNSGMRMELKCTYAKEPGNEVAVFWLYLPSLVDFPNVTRFRKNNGDPEEVKTVFGLTNQPLRSYIGAPWVSWLRGDEFQTFGVEVKNESKRLTGSFTGFKSPSSLAARKTCIEKMALMGERNKRNYEEKKRKAAEEAEEK